MSAREGNCLLAEAMDEYNRNRSGGSDASARGMKAVLKLAHERFASSESITAIAIQIDGKPVYLPTWCAERVRKALEPAVFDMEAAVEAFVDSYYLRGATYVPEKIAEALRAALSKAFAHLKPDMEALRRDAERYRWLRSHFRFANNSLREIWFDPKLEPNDSGVSEDLDQEVDAQAGKQGGGK